MASEQDLLREILAKKELSGIEKNYALHELRKYLKSNPRQAKKLSELTSKSGKFREIVKEVRAVLRRNVSLFEGRPEHRQVLLAELRQTSNASRIAGLQEHILATHLSTKERLGYFRQLYKKIFSITGKPKSVLDIGSGLNPVSFAFMDLPGSARYTAVEIDRNICSFLAEYFNIMKINGEARVLDALQMKKISKLPKSDIAFVFKFVELVGGTKNHKLSEQLVRALPARWVVVSFPTKTAGGRQMTAPRRKWIELMFKRLKYNYRVIRIPNEIFYVVRKSSIK